MKRLFILGSAGMLGHIVLSYLNDLRKYEIFDASFPVKLRDNSILLDATDRMQLDQIIRSLKPDIIVNCIGVLIQGSQKDYSTAVLLNSFLPHHLAKLQREHDGRLIHISTDCVFSGKKGNYVESDFKDARDIYGLSKALGEIENDIDLTFRTSIIGPELKQQGEGLFKWFMTQTGKVNGFTNVFWGGVTTLELAKAINVAIEHDLYGLCHLTTGYSISKFDLLNLIKRIWKRDEIDIIPDDSKNSDKSLRSIRSDFDFKPQSYEAMLMDLYEYLKNHNDIYRKISY